MQKSYQHSFLFAFILIFSGAVLAQDATGSQPAQPIPSGPAGDISSKSLAPPKVVEPWDTPSLEGSHLTQQLRVPLGDVDTVEGVYTHEVQRVVWRTVDPIDLYIMKPVGVKKPPVILYVYSYPFETDRFLDHDFCKFLVRNGFAAVGFPTALTGPRYFGRPMKEWFASEIDESLATSAHDVQMILNYLTERGDLDMSRVGMFGDGSGATIAILAAAADPRIKTLDLLDPWGDWPDWAAKSTRIPEKERPDFMGAKWQKKAAPLDPVKWLPQLKTQTIRLQFIKSVTITPAEAQAKIEAAAPPNAQIVHFDDAAAFKAAIANGSGFDWIKAQVGGGTGEYHAASQSDSKDSSSPSKDSQQ